MDYNDILKQYPYLVGKPVAPPPSPIPVLPAPNGLFSSGLTPVEQQTKNVFGMYPMPERLSVLPRYSAEKGLIAPELLYSIAKAISTPLTAMRGYQVTPEESVNFSLNSLGLPSAGLFSKQTANVASKVPKTPEFTNWFGKGQIKTESNAPKVMYHGTWASNIEEFRPGRANATFLSPDPKFASGFSVKAPSGSPNVLPVYTNVKQPFDYENAFHIKKLAESYNQLHGEPIISAKKSIKGTRGIPILEQIKNGSWSYIEDIKVQDAIKNAGFDAFYVKEDGIKNLGVYDPTQIKSVFNRGTFDPNDPRILYSSGVMLPPQQRQQNLSPIPEPAFMYKDPFGAPD